MILLSKSATSEELIVTLNEKKTLSAPVYYLFIFTHVTLNEEVKFIKSADSDESDYPTRFNQWTINTSTVFADKSVGQWIYRVYEQVSSINTNPAGLTEVENGRMVLSGTSTIATDSYDVSITKKAYNG